MRPDQADKQPPIYGTVHDDEDFKLVEMRLMSDSNNSSWIKRSPISKMEVYELLKEAEPDDPENYDFYLSWFILDESESSQRRLYKRISAPGTRNIRLSTLPVRKYLRDALKWIEVELLYPRDKYPQMTAKDRRGVRVNIPKEQLDDMLNGVFVDLKKQLGFPEVNPVEWRYEVTPEVIAKATDEKCRDYLERCSTKEFIFQTDFEKMCEKLEEEHGSDAKEVIKVLKKTKNRDHLAAFSVSTENREIFVSMANELGQHVTMEGWKFLRLIEEDGEAIRLHLFAKARWNTPDELFTFNHNKEGEVVGKFSGEKSYIDVGCLDEDKGDLMDRATFIVDSTYALCLYAMISRLIKDRDRFEELWNKAKTTNPVKDPFEMFPNALHRRVQTKV